MEKPDVAKLINSLYSKHRKAPGWKAGEKDGIDPEDISAHWDSLAEALDDVIGPGWRRGIPESAARELDLVEDPAPGAEPYSVYVIRLNDSVMSVKRFSKKNPTGELGCIYVGQTWHKPSVRFDNHKRGHKASALVK